MWLFHHYPSPFSSSSSSFFLHSLASPSFVCACVCLFLLFSLAFDELASSYFSLSLSLSLSQSFVFLSGNLLSTALSPFFISFSFIWLREIPTHQSWINNISDGSSTEENRREPKRRMTHSFLATVRLLSARLDNFHQHIKSAWPNIMKQLTSQASIRHPHDTSWSVTPNTCTT